MSKGYRIEAMGRMSGVIVFLIAAIWLRGDVSHSGGADVATPAAAPGAEQTLAIIVNQSNPVENFSMAELRKIFLGERSHWPNGRRITLVMMDPAQPERKVILREVYGMNEKDLSQHFIQGVFYRGGVCFPEDAGDAGGGVEVCVQCAGSDRVSAGFGCGWDSQGAAGGWALPDDKDYKLKLQARK